MGLQCPATMKSTIFTLLFLTVYCLAISSAKFNKSGKLLENEAASTNTTWRPVVLMHGLMATAEAMSHIEAWLKQDMPGVYVKNIEIGDGSKWQSLFIPMPKQIDMFTQQIRADPKLKNGFNLIGHSQGGIVTRGYIEKGDMKVHNYISLAGPHDGVFGVPAWNDICPDVDCHILDYLMDALWIDWKGLQDKLSFAAYWKDPLNYNDYLKDSIMLAPMNNEVITKDSATNKKSIEALNEVVLLYSSTDKIVIPRTSPAFDFYKIGQDNITVPLRQTQGYKNNILGWKTLDNRKALHIVSTPCGHQDLPRAVCKSDVYDKYILPYVKN